MNAQSKKGLMICIVVVVLVSAVVLSVFPWPSTFSHTLNAVKLDSRGNEIGIVQLQISGIRTRSLFKSRLAQVSVEGLDSHPALTVSFAREGSQPGPYSDNYSANFNHVYISLTPGGGGSLFGTIHASKDLDRWMIHLRPGDGGEAYYMASVSGAYSPEELIRYFQMLRPY